MQARGARGLHEVRCKTSCKRGVSRALQQTQVKGEGRRKCPAEAIVENKELRVNLGGRAPLPLGSVPSRLISS